jgi:hypothetical protein
VMAASTRRRRVSAERFAPPLRTVLGLPDLPIATHLN